MILPFAYMLSTSFKPNALVLSIPPQFLPHHATTSNYTAGLELESVRPLLRQLAVRRGRDDLRRRAALGDDGVRACPLPLSGSSGRSSALILVGLMVPGLMLLIPQFLLAKKLLLLNSLLGARRLLHGRQPRVEYVSPSQLLPGHPAASSRKRWSSTAAARGRASGGLILPLSRPALAAVAIFTFLASWDEFIWALTIINDPSKYTLPIGIALFQGQHSTSWGLVFAASAIAIGPVIAIFAALPAAVRLRDRDRCGEGLMAIPTGDLHRSLAASRFSSRASRRAAPSWPARPSRSIATPGCATAPSAHMRSTVATSRTRLSPSMPGSRAASKRTAR